MLQDNASFPFEKIKKFVNKKNELKYLKNEQYEYYNFWFPFFYKKVQKKEHLYSRYSLLYKNINEELLNYVSKLTQLFLEQYKNIVEKNLFLRKNKKNFNLIKFYVYYLCLEKNIFEKHIIDTELYIFITLDLRFKKPKLYSMFEQKCIFSITSGIILKQLKIKEKNTKKSQRVLNVMLKSSIKKLSTIYLNEKIVLQIKGTKQGFYKIIVFLKKFVDFKNIIFMYSPYIGRNKINIKPRKSIKRNLKKKLYKT